MVNPNDRSAEVAIVAIVLTVIAFLTVILRCYVRGWVVKAPGWDDGFMVAALILFIGTTACQVEGTQYGIGKRLAAMSVEARVKSMQYYLACALQILLASFCCRISVSIFLLRITVKRLQVRIIQVVIVMTVAITLLFSFIVLLQCQPVSHFWRQMMVDPVGRGICRATVTIAGSYVYTSVSVVCDLTLGILPIFIVRNLQMPKEAKVAVAAILSLGGLASAGSIARLVYIQTSQQPDFLYGAADFIIWSDVELGVGITAGNLATLGPLLRRCTQPSTHKEDENADRPPGPKPPVQGRRHRHPLSLPLTSLTGTIASRFRPDKLAVVVTDVHSSPQLSVSGSQDQLAPQEQGGSNRDSEGYGIYRRCEVSQMSDVESVKTQERV
ncbi:hypothetical protein BJX70DRAFT_395762 [Aspergillus crustosus]